MNAKYDPLLGALRFPDNLPISLTLAELQALQFTDLPIGQQYYVTDREWLLYADTPTVLKPVSGSLYLFNGQELPEGIESEVLIIDMGINEEGELNLYPPLSIRYILESVNATLPPDAYSQYYGVFFIRNDSMAEVFHYQDCIYTGQTQIFIMPSHVYSLSYTFQLGPNSQLRIIAKLRQIPYKPFPMPHIVSAETDPTGNPIIVTFSCDITGTNHANGTGGLQYNIDGMPNSIDNMSYGSNSNELLLFIPANPLNGQTVTLSYYQNLGLVVKNPWGGVLEEVVDYPVVNNVA